jgi:putative endonuclease
MAWVYILYSESLSRFYIGSTEQSPEDRLNKHLTNHSGFTAKAKDWAIVYREELETISEARIWELTIKKWKSKVLIHNLIRESK